jgi:hypothetical protein
MLIAADARVIPQSPSKTELTDTDPDQLSRLLQLELAQKRVEWKQKKVRYRSLRSLSFLLLFLVIIVALFAFFIISSRVAENRPAQHQVKPATHAP